MTETEQNIRESLLNTLSFLASKEQQLQFAAKVYYQIYQDELACWWFDTFYPDEPQATAIFAVSELQVLRDFSGVFENAIEMLKNTPMSMHSLQGTSQWESVVSGALEAMAKLRSAA